MTPHHHLQPKIGRAEFTLPYGILRSLHRINISSEEIMRATSAVRGFWVATVIACSLSAGARAGDLSVVGTGDGIDLLRALGAAYTADHPDTNVIVPPSIGSGGGVAAVGSDKEVLARIARPLSDSEREAGLVATPVFRLPSAFFVHRSANVKGVSAVQLADIYRGKITNWKDVGGADVRIKVVRREEQDSTLLVLRQSMPGWKDLPITEKSKTAVTTQEGVDTVKEVEGAIGFGPFTRALEMELVVLRIDGRYPTDDQYPSAVTLAFVHKKATVTPDARKFIDYVKATKAKTVLTQMGAVPVVE
jgi:phosphate transport system substrate-binding protein